MFRNQQISRKCLLRTLPLQSRFCINPQDPSQISAHLTKAKGRPWGNFEQASQGPPSPHIGCGQVTAGMASPVRSASRKGVVGLQPICPGGQCPGCLAWWLRAREDVFTHQAVCCPSQLAGPLSSKGLHLAQAWQRKWP